MRIREIILDKKEPTVYCESFVYEPSNFEEEKFGRLFMVGRIRNVSENSFYLINLLASRVKREYYNLRYTSAYQAFEAALKEGNKVLKENQERINWLGNLDFLIAIVDEKKIYFTLLGKMRSFILREDQIIDLVKDLILEKDVLFPFSTILQSNIKKDDILLFSTSNIFSKDFLIDKAKEVLPIEEEKIASLINPEDSGVALIVETGKTAEAVERLKPSLDVAKKPMAVSGFKLPKKEKLEEGKEKLKAGVEKSKGFAKKITEKGKSIFKPKIEKIGSSVKDKKEEVAPRIAIEKMHYSQKFKTKMSKALKQKWILIVVAAVIILGIFFGINQQQKAQQLRLVNQKIEEAKAKQDDSEKYIIYGDEEKALQSLTDGIEILDSIKNAPAVKKEEISKLKKELNKNIAELVGREVLSDIKPLFTIPTNENEKEWSASGLVITEDNFFAFSKNSAYVYKWNNNDKKGEFEEKEADILGATLLNKQAFFLLSPTSVVIDKKQESLQIEFPYDNTTVTKLDNFDGYIYLFDNKEGELIKYKASSSNIGDPNLWFKERNSGKDAVSMAIDGNIYLLYKDGKIKKYSGGLLRDEFESPKTYPEITSAVEIFTSENNKYLYITDPKNNRIIILDDTGNIEKEYESDQFKNMKAVWANANDKNIYVLAGNKVFEIER